MASTIAGRIEKPFSIVGCSPTSTRTPVAETSLSEAASRFSAALFSKSDFIPSSGCSAGKTSSAVCCFVLNDSANCITHSKPLPNDDQPAALLPGITHHRLTNNCDFQGWAQVRKDVARPHTIPLACASPQIVPIGLPSLSFPCDRVLDPIIPCLRRRNPQPVGKETKAVDRMSESSDAELNK